MCKIQFNIKIFYFIFCLWPGSSLPSVAQELKIIKNISDYHRTVEKDSLQRMVDLKVFVPHITYDLHYATKNNFTGKKLYKSGDKAFVRIQVANALKAVQKDLLKEGCGLKIWDAYRPYGATQKMWELIGDDRYVANPVKGSNHNRGLAVDITLIDSSGNELLMGTGFDNFSDTAHHNFRNLSPEILLNRQLLKTTMEKHGFVALETEWWHYAWPNNRNYDVLDLPFKKLGD